MIPPPARKYEPIWEQLKKKHKCTITAPIKMHKRIMTAVVKEKYQDIGFKYELQELGKVARISKSAKGSMLTFTLELSIGIGDL